MHAEFVSTRFEVLKDFVEVFDDLEHFDCVALGVLTLGPLDVVTLPSFDDFLYDMVCMLVFD